MLYISLVLGYLYKEKKKIICTFKRLSLSSCTRCMQSADTATFLLVEECDFSKCVRGDACMCGYAHINRVEKNLEIDGSEKRNIETGS